MLQRYLLLCFYCAHFAPLLFLPICFTFYSQSSVPLSQTPIKVQRGWIGHQKSAITPVTIQSARVQELEMFYITSALGERLDLTFCSAHALKLSCGHLTTQRIHMTAGSHFHLKLIWIKSLGFDKIKLTPYSWLNNILHYDFGKIILLNV